MPIGEEAGAALGAAIGTAVKIMGPKVVAELLKEVVNGLLSDTAEEGRADHSSNAQRLVDQWLQSHGDQAHSAATGNSGNSGQ